MTTIAELQAAIANLDTRTTRQEQRTYLHKLSPEQRAEYERILTETSDRQ
jgi:hypothetical protein